MKKDVAYCERCNEVFALSRLVADHDALDFDLTTPPSGVSFERTVNGFRLAASTRSPMALFLVPFTCVWSGGSLFGIYGSQILSGQFSVGLSLFGLPFLLGSLVLWGSTAMALFGRCAFEVTGDEAELFTGLGTIGWRRRFRWSDVRKVVERFSRNQSLNSPGVLQLVGRSGSGWRFGQGLTEARRLFVQSAIERLLAERRLGDALEPGTLALPETDDTKGALSALD